MSTLSPSERAATGGISSSSEASAALEHIVSTNEQRWGKETTEQVRAKLDRLISNPEAFVAAAVEQSFGDNLQAAIDQLGLHDIGSILQRIDQERITPTPQKHPQYSWANRNFSRHVEA